MNNGTAAPSEQLKIVIVGHVDHGKSTVIGRLLADTGSLPEGKLEQVRAMCERNARPFEYAFLLDALKNEQAQGITIDTARCFFSSQSSWLLSSSNTATAFTTRLTPSRRLFRRKSSHRDKPLPWPRFLI